MSLRSVACELGEQLGDGLIAILGHMLIAQCGLWCAVAQPSHEFGQAGSGGSRQHRTGMPQVVEAKVRATSDSAGSVEVTAQRGLGQVSPVLGREQQGVVVRPHMGGQMLLDGAEKVRRDGHATTTGLALGWADREAASGAHHSTLDADDAATGVHVDVDVAAP